jgi:hypothetical protein
MLFEKPFMLLLLQVWAVRFTSQLSRLTYLQEARCAPVVQHHWLLQIYPDTYNLTCNRCASRTSQLSRSTYRRQGLNHWLSQIPSDTYSLVVVLCAVCCHCSLTSQLSRPRAKLVAAIALRIRLAADHTAQQAATASAVGVPLPSGGAHLRALHSPLNPGPAV